MKPNRAWAAAIPVVAAVLLSACAKTVSDEHVIDEPVTIEPHRNGTALVTLTADAAARLGVRTAYVEEKRKRLLVPSAAVFVDPNGVFWVYTSPEPFAFIRKEIRVSDEGGGNAFLSDSPPVGTEVVTVGVAELYGAEYGIGH